MKKSLHKALLDAVKNGDCNAVARALAAGAKINANDGAALRDAVTEQMSAHSPS